MEGFRFQKKFKISKLSNFQALNKKLLHFPVFYTHVLHTKIPEPTLQFNEEQKIHPQIHTLNRKELSYGYSKKVHTDPIYPSSTSIEAPKRKFLLY